MTIMCFPIMYSDGDSVLLPSGTVGKIRLWSKKKADNKAKSAQNWRRERKGGEGRDGEERKGTEPSPVQLPPTKMGRADLQQSLTSEP